MSDPLLPNPINSHWIHILISALIVITKSITYPHSFIIIKFISEGGERNLRTVRDIYLNSLG